MPFDGFNFLPWLLTSPCPLEAVLLPHTASGVPGCRARWRPTVLPTAQLRFLDYHGHTLYHSIAQGPRLRAGDGVTGARGGWHFWGLFLFMV